MNWDEPAPPTAGELPDRLVGSDADGEDQAVEAALRPKDLGEFVGQERVRQQLDLVLKAAKKRGGTADHVLLSGAPGLGKTTLSMIIAAEMGAPIRITSGPAIQHAGDLAAILSSLQEGEVLFLDEIHRMSRPAEEMLYMAMEDFRVDVIVGKGPGATAIPLELPPFTLVGATTRAGLLPPPLRDRFGFTGHMEFYAPAELERVIHRSARLLDVEIETDGGAEIAGRSRGTPVSPTGCCAGSGTMRRSEPTAGSPARSPRRPWRSTRWTPGASTGWTGPCCAPCSSCSAAARSVCRRWRSPSVRSARRSRRSPNRSWSGRACWRVLPVVGWLPGRPGRTSAWSRPSSPGPRPGWPVRTVTAWRLAPRNPSAMLGVVSPARTRLDSADALPPERHTPP